MTLRTDTFIAQHRCLEWESHFAEDRATRRGETGDQKCISSVDCGEAESLAWVGGDKCVATW